MVAKFTDLVFDTVAISTVLALLASQRSWDVEKPSADNFRVLLPVGPSGNGMLHKSHTFPAMQQG